MLVRAHWPWRPLHAARDHLGNDRASLSSLGTPERWIALAQCAEAKVAVDGLTRVEREGGPLPMAGCRRI